MLLHSSTDGECKLCDRNVDDQEQDARQTLTKEQGSRDSMRSCPHPHDT